MARYHNINGTLEAAETASLKINDLAIMRGFGIFDYFLVQDRVPLFIEDYLARFYKSASIMTMDVPVPPPELHARILELIDANGLDNAAIRLILTGGYSPDSYTPVNPNLLVLHHDFKPAPQTCYTDGVKLLTHEYQRDVPEVKTINYAMGIILIKRMKDAGAIEPLYHANGYLKEAVRSNFFIVDSKDRLITPNSDILMGITRKHVIKEAKAHGITVEERTVALEEVREAKEAFITGSNKRVMPVVQVDDTIYGNGKPGPLTRRIMNLYEQAADLYVDQRKNGT